jgi:hypothetical protein
MNSGRIDGPSGRACGHWASLSDSFLLSSKKILGADGAIFFENREDWSKSSAIRASRAGHYGQWNANRVR